MVLLVPDGALGFCKAPRAPLIEEDDDGTGQILGNLPYLKCGIKKTLQVQFNPWPDPTFSGTELI